MQEPDQIHAGLQYGPSTIVLDNRGVINPICWLILLD